MATLEGAAQVIKHLNGKELFEDGSRMNIFYSKLKKLQLKNSNSGGYGTIQTYKDKEKVEKSIENINKARQNKDIILIGDENNGKTEQLNDEELKQSYDITNYNDKLYLYGLNKN